METINAVTFNQCFDANASITARRSEAIGVIALDPPSKNAETNSEEQSLDRDATLLRVKARAELRLAQRERDAHKATRDRIQDAVARANALSATIERKLAKLVNLDKRIAIECAESLLRSFEQDTAAAFELSPKMKRLAEKKFALENQLAAFRRALDCLGQDLATAESSLRKAEDDVERAAIAVAATEMEPIAAELARAENQAARLRRLLLGYGALRHAGGFLPMSSATAQLLRAPPKNAVVGGSAHCFEATAQWASYLQQLGMNCEATFDAESGS
ncbi:MAG: hypothetical protein AB7F41_06890 [Methylocystis sp.]|uniref:hypothetical protein n=1 Tax=Methylocystis sp. TaxID=1911079 RepID=UPI003D135082